MVLVPKPGVLPVVDSPVENLDWGQLSPQERAFLIAFARNYLTGRRVMCWSAQAIVMLGAIAASLAAVLAFFHQVLGLRAP